MRKAENTLQNKVTGVHYTPPWLAGFLAERIARHLNIKGQGSLRILDPACGDGILLDAIASDLAEKGLVCADICGVEVDESALSSAKIRLQRFGDAVSLVSGDFLEISTEGRGQLDLWCSEAPKVAFEVPFDLVIANPPYVRTQHLGAQKSQRLAQRFGLTGRVDLYHAFLVALAETLHFGGTIGVITSNRFLTTGGAAMIRGFLAAHYDICEVIDLGDTKMFDAAVLPAIFVGQRRKPTSSHRGSHRARFLRVYSEPASVEKPAIGLSLKEVLNRGESGCYSVAEGIFRVTTGDLVLGNDPKQVWALTTAEEEEWIARVRRGACGVIQDVADVRVGIKTTADEVFIRTDWDKQPPPLLPESVLLRPLLRHEHARRWRLSTDGVPPFRVLYPHEVSEGRRRAIDIHQYPKAEAYLKSNRRRLEKRHYLIEAGRNWYEIWVPQDPDAWGRPKIVFPDISPEPRFYLDTDGYIVDGDCYWIALHPAEPEEMLFLLLAVVNSRLMARFHDLVFNNRLYSNRRRYITQYVAKYPYPSLEHPASQELVRLVQQFIKGELDPVLRFDISTFESQVDLLVEQAFGLVPKAQNQSTDTSKQWREEHTGQILVSGRPFRG